MIVLHKRHLYLAGLCLCFLAALGAVLWQGSGAYTAAFAAGTAAQRPTVVVDAGHGGEDGGAVAADGTVEAGLNLAVALRVRDLLAFTGVDTVMTRAGEDAIYDPGCSTLREQWKVFDLQPGGAGGSHGKRRSAEHPPEQPAVLAVDPRGPGVLQRRRGRVAPSSASGVQRR